jgi:hypothetical protein
MVYLDSNKSRWPPTVKRKREVKNHGNNLIAIAKRRYPFISFQFNEQPLIHNGENIKTINPQEGKRCENGVLSNYPFFYFFLTRLFKLSPHARLFFGLPHAILALLATIIHCSIRQTRE